MHGGLCREIVCALIALKWSFDSRFQLARRVVSASVLILVTDIYSESVTMHMYCMVGIVVGRLE